MVRAMSEPEHTAPTAHPPLPVVHDEAGDTPAWLPVSGLVLFVLFALMTFWRASHPAEEEITITGDGTEPAVVVAPPTD